MCCGWPQSGLLGILYEHVSVENPVTMGELLLKQVAVRRPKWESSSAAALCPNWNAAPASHSWPFQDWLYTPGSFSFPRNGIAISVAPTPLFLPFFCFKISSTFGVCVVGEVIVIQFVDAQACEIDPSYTSWCIHSRLQSQCLSYSHECELTAAPPPHTSWLQISCRKLNWEKKTKNRPSSYSEWSEI